MGYEKVQALIEASPSDYEVCRRLHKRHGTTYYFATMRMPEQMRWQTHALYGFVRTADEWVDDRAAYSVSQAKESLARWREEIANGLDRGHVPKDPVLRAFLRTCQQVGIDSKEPMHFLEAMEMDLLRSRYETFSELEAYMRGSAAAVGIMMCRVLGAQPDNSMTAQAMALGNAMQLTNFLRDIGEDYDRGRIYLPLEELDRFGVLERDIADRRVSDEFVALMRFQVGRARRLYEDSEPGILGLPKPAVRPVLLARVLYARILDRIEANGYDVFQNRARTSKIEKLSVATMVALWPQRFARGTQAVRPA